MSFSQKIMWEIPTISRKDKSVFHRQSNKKAALHLSLRFLLHVVVFVMSIIALSEGSYFFFGILVLTNGVLVSFLGWAGAGHEYFHGTAFKNKKLNRTLFRLCSVISWNNWGWFEVSHQLHHKYTLHTLDPESPEKRGSGITPLRLLWLFSIDFPLILRRWRILFLNVFGIVPGISSPLRELLDSKPNFVRKIRLGAISVWLYQLLVLCLLWQLSPILAILNFLSAFTFTFINKIVEINQHIGMTYHSQDFRQNSRTIRFNRIIEFLYSNMNFHSEHHMFPGVPYYKLPTLNSYLVRHGVVEKPKEGFVVATKIAMAAKVGLVQPRDCLSCFAKCGVSID